MTSEYFVWLHDWLDNGGYAHIAYYLKHMTIDPKYNPAGYCRRAPITTSQPEAIEKSAGQIESEIREAIKSGVPGFQGGFISSYKLDRLIQDKKLRLNRSKRSAMLETLGYRKCEFWTDGRSPRPIMAEGNTRPIIYVHENMDLSGDLFQKYLTAQFYPQVLE